jgi:phosphatidylglycerophosphate synthase
MKISMVSLKEVVDKTKRKDDEANQKLHFFASKFSKYFSYLFIKLGFTADQVTIVFFLIGLSGAAFFNYPNFKMQLIGYLLYRLHIIIDMSDGDVARFNQSYSVRGSYWDAMIHATLYPLFFFAASISFWLSFENDQFLVLGGLGAIITSLLLSVKNNYYKALYFFQAGRNKNNNTQQSKMNKKSLKFKMFFWASEFLSFEGFLPMVMISNYTKNQALSLITLVFYGFAFLLIILVKFYSLSYKGYYQTKI